MTTGFDFTELSKFERDLLALAKDFEKGKHSKSFLKKEAKKLRTLTLKKAKSKVKEKTGNLFKGIKTGKTYTYRADNSSAIRVYGGKPAHHIHLLEYGHRQVTKDGREIGFVKGKHFFEEAAKEFTDDYYKDMQNFLDDILDKGL